MNQAERDAAAAVLQRAADVLLLGESPCKAASQAIAAQDVLWRVFAISTRRREYPSGRALITLDSMPLDNPSSPMHPASSTPKPGPMSPEEG